jgi:hypothetical protein
MGQKVSFSYRSYPLYSTYISSDFCTRLDADEHLVGVAFVDVGVYVTSLRSLKKNLLVGDAAKGVMFVAFQVCLFKFVCTKLRFKSVFTFRRTPISLCFSQKICNELPQQVSIFTLRIRSFAS